MAGGQGPEAGKLEALAATHKQNQAALVKAGFNNTFAASVPTYTHVARPSTDEEKIAELIRLGTINSKNLWVVCGATVFNSEVVMKAQAAILAKADSDAAASADAAALEFMQAEVAAAAAKERRGDKGDSTMSGADLAAAVKFVHLKKSMKGWSSYSTVKKRVQFLEALSPAWTELVVCDAPAATPVLAAAAAAAAEPTWPGASGGSAPPPGWPHTTPLPPPRTRRCAD